MQAGIQSIIGRPGIRLIVLGVVTFCAFAMAAFGVAYHMTGLIPLFFYIPIIVAASWYPRRGVIFALALGLIQLFTVYLFISPDIPLLTYATATASFYVLVATAVIIASLSGGLREEEAKYHAIFDHSEAAVFLLSDSTGLRVEEVNRRGRELTGFPPGILEGGSFFRVAGEDSVREWLPKLEEDGVASNFESTFSTRGGGSIPVLLSAARLPGGRIVCIAMDISARKVAEEELSRRNRELSVINQVISVTGGALTVPNLVEEAIGRTCDLLGFSGGRVYLVNTGRNLVELQYYRGDIPGSGPDTFYERDAYPFPDALRGVAVYPEPSPGVPSAVVPLACDRETEGVFHLYRGEPGPLRSEERAILESIGKEVGCAMRKMKLAEDLAVANQRANLYLDILVHDVNNANMTSLGYAELIHDMVEGKPQEITAKMIEVIRKSGEIIRNLETIRRIHEKAPDLKPVELDQVIRSELHIFPGARPVTAAVCNYRVYADDLLPEVFSNILGNCIKFGGKDVTVSCTARENDDEVTVAVADDGPGIPDAMKPLIFDRFQRGSANRTGKGLGLYIVKTLVERYGGRVWAEDRVAGDHTKGVKIVFTLRKFQG